MQPQSTVGQLSAQMAAGTPELDQSTGSSPNAQPFLQPPTNPPMPERTGLGGGVTALHRAFMRRGKEIPAQLGGKPAMPTPQANPQPQPQGQPMKMSEAEHLIGALEKFAATMSKRLDVINKHEEAIRSKLLPQNNGNNTSE